MISDIFFLFTQIIASTLFYMVQIKKSKRCSTNANPRASPGFVVVYLTVSSHCGFVGFCSIYVCFFFVIFTTVFFLSSASLCLCFPCAFQRHSVISSFPPPLSVLMGSPVNILLHYQPCSLLYPHLSL